MISDLTILFGATVVIFFIISIVKENTILMALNSGLSFIMCVLVRLIVYPYAFIDSTDVIVTGSFVFDDVSAVIMFFIFGILNMVLFFAYRVQHSKEELQRGDKGND